MVDSAPEPLRLVLRQADGELVVGDLADPASRDLAEVELVAFAAHGRLSGRIALDRARLTDMLNEHEAFELDHVLATRLPEGEARVLRRILVRREELYIVHAGGPRGDRAQRTKTIARAITVKSGPYLVTGDVHTAPGIDPLLHFRRRHSMVPLTDAIVVYQTARGLIEEGVETVVINRDLADWVRRAEVVGGASMAGLRALARNGRGINITG
jgi:hypothetical protein